MKNNESNQDVNCGAAQEETLIEQIENSKKEI